MFGDVSASVDQSHIPVGGNFKGGQKVKARILCHYPSVPPKFLLSLAQHVVDLDTSLALQEKFPMGTTLDLTVKRVQADKGLHVDVGSDSEGFVHVGLTIGLLTDTAYESVRFRMYLTIM